MRLGSSQRRNLDSIFRGVRHTLLNRGLYRKLGSGGGVQEVAWKRAIVLDDLGVVAFEVDTLRLPVKIEQLLDPDVTHQMQAALGGRQVRVTNSRGLVFSVQLQPDPGRQLSRLPRRVRLDLDARPDGVYLVPVGQGREGPVWRSLLETGHILVGGESGSGKSTWLNAMLAALLAGHSPEELQVAIVDPKQVEFQAYRGLPHLFEDLATEVDQAEALLARVLFEMDRRAVLFSGVGAKNLGLYNDRVDEPLSLVLLVIDEVTDIALQAGLKSDFYRDLIRLASKGRAFGLVLVLATQNPKAEVLNTLIRGNLSTRIAFRVTTVEHSRVILGEGGAQTLPRTIRGRMVTRLGGDELEELQGFYISDTEIAALAGRLRDDGKDAQAMVISDLEREMALFAVEELAGEFHTDTIWQEFTDRVSRREVQRLARRWEHLGWLTLQRNPAEARWVTDKLLDLVTGEEANDEG